MSGYKNSYTLWIEICSYLHRKHREPNHGDEVFWFHSHFLRPHWQNKGVSPSFRTDKLIYHEK